MIDSGYPTMLVWNTHSPVVLRSAPKDLPTNLDPSARIRVAGIGRMVGASACTGCEVVGWERNPMEMLVQRRYWRVSRMPCLYPESLLVL